MQRKGGRLASAPAGWKSGGRAKSARIKRSELLGALSFRRHSPARHRRMDGRAGCGAAWKAAFPRHALHQGRRHDRLLHRRASVQRHHSYRRFIDFYKSSVFPVGVDAHIDPLGSIEFAEDSRKNRFYLPGRCRHRPLRIAGKFPHSSRDVRRGRFLGTFITMQRSQPGLPRYAAVLCCIFLKNDIIWIILCWGESP